MSSFTSNTKDIESELFNVIRQFVPDFELSDFSVEFTHLPSRVKDEKSRDKITVNGAEFFFTYDAFTGSDKLTERRIYSRNCKLSLYKALSGYFKRDLPWGSLTGVRPTRLAYELSEGGKYADNVAEKLNRQYLVSTDKAELASDIIKAQKAYITSDENSVDFYVHIPFCPSRCYYCSFITALAASQKKLISPYVDALISEIEFSAKLIKNSGKKIHSVYIGGGTPTVLDDEEFERVLAAVPYKDVEYTVEAGRPDTITKEKLGIMKSRSVTRISVNPQTLSDDTLKAIGRGHTAQQFFDAFRAAREFGFSINVDLIAGLYKETLDDFKKSIEGAAALRPENLTVHTLSQKRGSYLIERKDAKESSGNSEQTEKMMEYAHSFLRKSGYIPYYLYRQKRMSGNLENVGYTLNGFQCVNNISTMEETLSVVASGAGAISKRIFYSGGNKRIERLANVKDPLLYTNTIIERLEKKSDFFKD